MTESAQKLFDLLVSISPIAMVAAVFWFFAYTDRLRARPVSAETEEIYSALDNIWPIVTAEAGPRLLTEQADSFIKISRLVTERAARKKLGGNK